MKVFFLKLATALEVASINILFCLYLFGLYFLANTKADFAANVGLTGSVLVLAIAAVLPSFNLVCYQSMNTHTLLNTCHLYYAGSMHKRQVFSWN